MTSQIKMAFNKTSVVLLALLVVATIADARVDRFEASLKSEREDVCSSCECKEESGTTKCYRYVSKVGSCPLDCRDTCLICTFSEPPICFCTYEVETCTPKPCLRNSAAKLENLLILNGNY